MKKEKLVVVFQALFCCFLWGLAFPAMKLLYVSFHVCGGETGRQILFAGLRFVLAGSFLLTFARYRGENPFSVARGSWRDLLLLGFIMTALQYGLYNIAMAHMAGSKGSLINSSNAFISVLLSHFFYKEDRLTPRKIGGCVMGFAGLYILCCGPEGFGPGAWDIVMLVSAASFSFGNIFCKRLSEKVPPTLAAGWQMLLGGLFLLVLGFCMGGHIGDSNFSGWACVVFFVIQSAVSYLLWSKILKENNVSSIGIYTCLIPAIGLFTSSFLPNEPKLSVSQLLPLLLMTLGIYLVNSRQNVEVKGKRNSKE